MAEDASYCRGTKSRRPARREVDPEILTIAETASAMALAALTGALEAAESGGLLLEQQDVAVITAAREEERTRYRSLRASGTRRLSRVRPANEQPAGADTQTSQSL
jgi:hypothetical protein